MMRWLKLVSVLFALAVVVLGAVVLALQYWVGSGDFRSRVEREASAAIGLPVRLRAVSVGIWPLPSVALDGMSVASQPPLTLERIEARPVWMALLHGRLEVATLVVRKAVIPAPAVAAISAAMARNKQHTATAPAPAPAPPGERYTWWPKHAHFDDLSWVDANGNTTGVEARIAMDDDGRPATASLKVLRGRMAGASATVRREGEAWLVAADIGGGKLDARLTLQAPGTSPATSLQGSYRIAGVEVSALTAPSRTLTGRLDATGTLRAALQDLGKLRETLVTQTQFTVRNAVVQGIDLREAVRTVGLNRGGSTPLDTLTGRLATQGSAMQLTQLVASAGKLSATGNVSMAPSQALGGTLDVSLDAAVTGKAINVPLQVGGTLDSPSVTLSRGALIGAAIGAMVNPGDRKASGAHLGDRIGKGLGALFGK